MPQRPIFAQYELYSTSHNDHFAGRDKRCVKDEYRIEKRVYLPPERASTQSIVSEMVRYLRERRSGKGRSGSGPPAATRRRTPRNRAQARGPTVSYRQRPPPPGPAPAKNPAIAATKPPGRSSA